MLKKGGQVPVSMGLGESREHGRQEMQQLGTQEVEGPGHFKKHESRRGQPAPHQFPADPIGHLALLVRGLELGRSVYGKGVPPTLPRPSLLFPRQSWIPRDYSPNIPELENRIQALHALHCESACYHTPVEQKVRTPGAVSRTRKEKKDETSHVQPGGPVLRRRSHGRRTGGGPGCRRRRAGPQGGEASPRVLPRHDRAFWSMGARPGRLPKRPSGKLRMDPPCTLFPACVCGLRCQRPGSSSASPATFRTTSRKAERRWTPRTRRPRASS